MRREEMERARWRGKGCYLLHSQTHLPFGVVHVRCLHWGMRILSHPRLHSLTSITVLYLAVVRLGGVTAHLTPHPEGRDLGGYEYDCGTEESVPAPAPRSVPQTKTIQCYSSQCTVTSTYECIQVIVDSIITHCCAVLCCALINAVGQSRDFGLTEGVTPLAPSSADQTWSRNGFSADVLQTH
jgi:hypothetical protein